MEFWGCSGISWTICKQSAPRCRQITTPTPHHSFFTGRIALHCIASYNISDQSLWMQLRCGATCEVQATTGAFQYHSCSTADPAVRRWTGIVSAVLHEFLILINRHFNRVIEDVVHCQRELLWEYCIFTSPVLGYTHTHTHPFNGPFSWTTQVSWYRKGKTNLDFTEARDSEW